MPRQTDSLGSLIEDFDRDATRAGRASKGGSGEGNWKRPAMALAAVVATIGALTVLAIQATNAPPDYGARTRSKTAMDAVTGEVFKKFRIAEGDTLPWVHPDTGERTLYPVERCYWNKDGTARTEPTYVILNEMLGEEGPTTCPDCGRRVVRHNPEPPVEVMMRAFEAERDRR